MTPEEACQHNTVYSTTFWGNLPTTIWDGTYLYLQKSSNYSKGRQTFSMHKFRHLSKFMSIVLPDGYVLATIGPYYSDGKNNDAGMTSDILKDEANGIMKWMESAGEQVVVLDRGFRNVLDELNAIPGVSTKMPTVSAKKTKEKKNEEEVGSSEQAFDDEEIEMRVEDGIIKRKGTGENTQQPKKKQKKSEEEKKKEKEEKEKEKKKKKEEQEQQKKKKKEEKEEEKKKKEEEKKKKEEEKKKEKKEEKKVEEQKKREEGTSAKQNTVEQNNQSRLCTKNRWVVEAYHGRFKKFKFFDNRQPTCHLTQQGKFLRITTAALNKFRPPLFDTSKGTVDHKAIAEEMLKRSKETVNPVGQRVQTGALSSRGRQYEEHIEVQPDEYPINETSAITDFPKLTINHILHKITLGSYQIEQAKHYADEHLSSNGGFHYYVHRQATDLIRVRLQSRHKNKTKYYVHIQFTPDKKDSPGHIEGWYCQCQAGNRTVGCCAHVATVVWYLGYARHNGYDVSNFLNKFWKGVKNSNASEDLQDSDEEDGPEDVAQ
eukprot:Lithocolla_globosa_v1_NODE_456_length_3997_cov_19.695840.p1 type:complete len:543 gc:universal NODE_456_length_3997_cov_19.695840:1883-255(-)